MITNRELDLDDYLAIARRRFKLIAILAVAAAAIGLASSFCFSSRFSSRALVQVEKQTVPSGYVRPIVTSAAVDRVGTIQQQVLSRNRLEPLVSRLGLARNGKSVEEAIGDIQRDVAITEASPPTGGLRRSGDFFGFYVSFTADNPQDAQQICSQLTSMLLEENLKMRQQVAASTQDFLARQLAEAKRDLDEKDNALAAFKARFLGQLPSDADTNLKILTGLNAELDANTQMLNRAQQDKAYTQSILDQQVTEWKSSQTTMTSDNVEQKLIALQTQLVALQTRYTDRHPEVIKMKKDIAALQAKQKELNAAANDGSEDTGKRAEPPSVRQLRQQIYQSDGIMARGAHQQKLLQARIDSYQSRLTLSPQVEEQFKQLTRDLDVAHNIYDRLLLNKSESEIQTDLERQQQGEQMHVLDPPNLPDSPSFPIRWKFAGGGLGAGLALGISLSFLLELRDKAIRNEKDVLAALELPMLSSIPWVSPAATSETNGFGGRVKTLFEG